MLRLRAVRKLEKAGKHPSVLLGVRENRLLEVDSVRQEDVVLIHSGTQIAWQPAVRLTTLSLPKKSPIVLQPGSTSVTGVTQTDFNWHVAFSSPGP